MNGFLLAAGRGTRLKSLTEHTAKPALPVAGLPMFAYSLSLFYHAKVTKLAVNVHHCPETITDLLERAEHPWRLLVSEESELLDTGGGIKRCEGFLADAPLLVANADIVCDVNVADLVAAHRARRAALTLVVVPHPRAHEIAPVTISGDNRITDINHTIDPHSSGAHLYAGVALFEPEMFAYLRHEPSSVVYTGYTGLIAAGKNVAAYVHDGLWYDCGTPESYALVNAEVSRDDAHWRNVLAPQVQLLRTT